MVTPHFSVFARETIEGCGRSIAPVRSRRGSQAHGCAMATQLAQAPTHQRHRPEQTLLYQLVEQYYPAFSAALEEAGRRLPRYVEQEFEDFLKCGRLEYGFLRVRCGDCHAEKRVAFSCKRRGFCPSCGAKPA